jgi:hypothetical protein
VWLSRISRGCVITEVAYTMVLLGIGVERLRDLPAEWSRQFEALGLNPECS